MNYIELNDAIKLYNAKAVKNKINPYTNLRDDFLAIATEVLGTVELKRNADGLVSATKTLEAVEDPYKRALIEITSSPARGKLLKKPAGKAPEYASLTPIFMYGHKKRGVGYEEWDKNDPMLGWLIGTGIHKTISTFLGVGPFVLTPEEALALRGTAVTGSLTSYGQKSFTSNGINFKPGSPAAHIILQTWLANRQLRCPEAMILDPWDWDNTPEAFDEIPVVEEPVVVKEATRMRMPGEGWPF